MTPLPAYLNRSALVGQPEQLPCGAWVVPGFVRVECRPHRTAWAAESLAHRFAASPLQHLPAALHMRMPGVVDLRPRYGPPVAGARPL